jgi:ATP-binding cassette, subfamily D (ALD), peroxisomal long-chain fatty acid import protein
MRTQGRRNLPVDPVRALTPPFGTYTSTEASLSGALRHTHSRIVEHAEEIAFLGGEETEKLIVERDYFGLVKHVNRVLRIRAGFALVEEGIIK